MSFSDRFSGYVVMLGMGTMTTSGGPPGVGDGS